MVRDRRGLWAALPPGHCASPATALRTATALRRLRCTRPSAGVVHFRPTTLALPTAPDKKGGVALRGSACSTPGQGKRWLLLSSSHPLAFLNPPAGLHAACCACRHCLPAFPPHHCLPSFFLSAFGQGRYHLARTHADGCRLPTKTADGTTNSAVPRHLS